MRTVTLHTEPYTFLISRSVLSRMRNLSAKIWKQKNQNTHFMFNTLLVFRKLYLLWDNVEPGRPKMTIWRMRIACWIPAATNTHSECIIIIAFPQREWLQEFASVLRYTTYMACLVTGWHTLVHIPWSNGRSSNGLKKHVINFVNANAWKKNKK
jgi:hypothetical protein